MRVTILPQAIILTKAHRSVVSIRPRGVLWPVVSVMAFTTANVFWPLLPNYTNILVLFFYLHH